MTSSYRQSELEAVLNSGNITLTELADGTGVVLDIASSQVLSLNSTGFFILKQLKNAIPIEEIPLLLSGQFDVTEKTACEDTISLLSDLTKLLLDNDKARLVL